jgi:hypothetical protein
MLNKGRNKKEKKKEQRKVASNVRFEPKKVTWEGNLILA